MFCHERLIVYQRSVEFSRGIIKLIRSIPPGNSDIVSQLRRAAMSIPLNITEGAGKTGANDKKRFYAFARGSALECAAIIDLLIAWEILEQKGFTDSLKLLEEVTAMLAVLSDRK